ncbi:neurogenic locus notch homolog protein 3-like [Ruditapes philippinarum]|uniref:neurogenic locus notch homolog protein 3-like n=1 Tax=Ruditapes philippinarum TaxID=129788 RepID=UPI00295B9E94|nr:neurogenic locus notch homolog protein 3-like [Ruditapes philippinarum]
MNVLGCIDNQQCAAHGNIPATIVGRDLYTRQTTDCLECCSSDHCNKILCEHLKPQSCIDDESIDCARLNSLFNICNDISQAKKVCPKFCNLCNVVDGNWTPWSAWSSCDVTCEKGLQTRTRSCTNPAPQYGGQMCLGNSTDNKVCELDLCPIHGGWGQWQEWGSCSVTCDMGMKSRSRDCSNPPPSRFGDHCFGHNQESQLCLPKICSNGGWTAWESWRSCSVTCGSGIKSRFRACTNPKPSPYGQFCQGNNIEIDSCSQITCDSSHCQPNPCIHGSCIDLRNDFVCTCDQGFEGRICNISNSMCKSSPCVHGTCFDNKDGFVCSCSAGFRGKYCNTSIDFCSSNPCIRGHCVNEVTNYTCNCPPGFTGNLCETVPASDCYDIQKMSLGKTNGIYGIQLWKSKVYKEIYCDFETAGGGWSVVQRRFNGSVDFYRNHANYSVGFGDINGEFWLGLHYIFELSSQNITELRIDVDAADGTKAFEVYRNFSLDEDDYRLHIDKGYGTAGDVKGLYYSNGRRFSTYDHDVDDYNGPNNAQLCHGGWWYWYSPCTFVNLNGDYITPGTVHSTAAGDAGMIYNSFKGKQSLKSSRMMIRRV